MTQIMWTLSDPETGETYAMEVNPADRDSMEPIGDIQPTSAFDPAVWQNPDGVHAGWGYTTWESVTPPTQFNITGTTYTEAQHNALWDWTERVRRFRLHDHFGWVWEVIFTKYDARLAPTRNSPWRHKYTISGLCFRRIT